MDDKKFSYNIVVTLGLSCLGLLLFTVLTPSIPMYWIIRIAVSLTSIIYLGFLLFSMFSDSTEIGSKASKIGLLSLLTVIAIAVMCCWVFSISLPLFVSIHVGLIWLVRVSFYHCRFITAIVDFILLVLSLSIAVWVLGYTSSLFLSFWCFYLSQTLFVYLPSRNLKSSLDGINDAVAANSSFQAQQQCFQRSYHTAESAVKRLAL